MEDNKRFTIPEEDIRFTETLTPSQQIQWWKSKYRDAMSIIQMMMESDLGTIITTENT